MSRCSRGSIPNPQSGRCKACTSFTLAELKSIAKTQRVSQRGTKQELCDRLVKHFMKKMGTVRSPSKSTRSKSTRSKSTRGRSTTKKKSAKKTTKRRAPSRSSSYYRSKSPSVVITRSGPYTVATTRYPTKGKGSFQKRHHSSKRKGPSLPAQAHRWQTARGNDGYDWESRPDKTGRFRWYRL